MDDPLPKSPSPDALAARTAAALRDLQSLAQSVSTTRRERMSRLEDELTRRLDAIADAVSQQRDTEHNLAEDAAQSQAEIAGLHATLEAREQKLDERRQELAEVDRRQLQREAELNERHDELERRATELKQRLRELETRESQVETAAAEASASAEELRAREVQWQTRLETAEQARDEAANRCAEWEARESTWNATKVALESERDQLASDLAATRENVVPDSANETLAAELDELKQKFALALDDVQRFRTRVAVLEQKLAERPATDESDSSELVALRAERDALSEKVTELENRGPNTTSEDEQELADLQRRFEMAVEDVRELKSKNARLEALLDTARRQSHSAGGDPASMDWESQKRRLLASLEGDEGQQIDQQERNTIENTIQITDAIVAEKDQLIDELKSQIAAKTEIVTTPEDSHDRAVSVLLDSDEIIVAHRKQAAEFEQELEAKLRTFELEMSVDRARIARQKVELDQLRLSLEAERNAQGGGTGNGGAPKRRWLSKLGLGGEEGE